MSTGASGGEQRGLRRGLLIAAEFPQIETETDLKSKNRNLAAGMVTHSDFAGEEQQKEGEAAGSHSGQPHRGANRPRGSPGREGC